MKITGVWSVSVPHKTGCAYVCAEWYGMDGPSHIHTSAAIIYQKQLLYDAALVHLVHVGLIAAFAFDMQNYAQFINAAMRAFPLPQNAPLNGKPLATLFEPAFPLLWLGHFPLTQIQILFSVI